MALYHPNTISTYLTPYLRIYHQVSPKHLYLPINPLNTISTYFIRICIITMYYSNIIATYLSPGITQTPTDLSPYITLPPYPHIYDHVSLQYRISLLFLNLIFILRHTDFTLQAITLHAKLSKYLRTSAVTFHSN